MPDSRTKRTRAFTAVRSRTKSAAAFLAFVLAAILAPGAAGAEEGSQDGRARPSDRPGGSATHEGMVVYLDETGKPVVPPAGAVIPSPPTRLFAVPPSRELEAPGGGKMIILGEDGIRR